MPATNTSRSGKPVAVGVTVDPSVAPTITIEPGDEGAAAAATALPSLLRLFHPSEVLPGSSIG
jgi:hypothetical protein